jgi:hypothetical protein
MNQSLAFKNGLNALLSPEESILILIDHQPFQFANLHSHEPTMVVNNVVGLAKAAKVFNVPTILTTVVEGLINGLQDVFPDQKPIDRTWINTWEDARVVDAVKKTGRKKIVMAALWSEICLAMPAIQAAGALEPARRRRTAFQPIGGTNHVHQFKRGREGSGSPQHRRSARRREFRGVRTTLCRRLSRPHATAGPHA